MNSRSSENVPRARFEPNATVTWGYDTASNRVLHSAQPGSWTYDNLNRILTSPSMTYDHDILGNRLLKSGGGGGSTTTMTWDDLNRMTGFKAGYNAQHTYAYRADGMRTSKSAGTGASSATWTRYRYDGQMGVDDIEGTTVSGVSTISAVTRTGLGARSVEVISSVDDLLLQVLPVTFQQASSEFFLHHAHVPHIVFLLGRLVPVVQIPCHQIGFGEELGETVLGQPGFGKDGIQIAGQGRLHEAIVVAHVDNHHSRHVVLPKTSCDFSHR